MSAPNPETAALESAVAAMTYCLIASGGKTEPRSEGLPDVNGEGKRISIIPLAIAALSSGLHAIATHPNTAPHIATALSLSADIIAAAQWGDEITE